MGAFCIRQVKGGRVLLNLWLSIFAYLRGRGLNQRNRRRAVHHRHAEIIIVSYEIALARIGSLQADILAAHLLCIRRNFRR